MTRWKLMAGVFGLSLAGLVAVAGPQCPKDDPAAGRKGDAPPPVLPVVALVGEPARPPVDAPPKPAELPAVAPSLPPIAPTPAPPELPKLDLPATAAPALPMVAAAPPSIGPVPELPPPATPLPLNPAPPRAEPPKLEVTPVSRPVELPAPKLDLPATPPPMQPAAAAPPPPPPPPPPAVTDAPPPSLKVRSQALLNTGRVRVLAALGDDRPAFEVLSADGATLLKVLSDKMDVRSPAVSGDQVSPVKAVGKVRFTAGGCEGVCDELTVNPVTGEVLLSGYVRVTCRKGDDVNELGGDRMTLKLSAGSKTTAAKDCGPDPAVVPVTFR